MKKKNIANIIFTTLFLIACVVVILIFAPDLSYFLSSNSKRAAIEKNKTPVVDTSVSYQQIYDDYQTNGLRADDKYKNNWYRITAEIYDISDALLSDAALTLKIEVENHFAYVFLFAYFNENQDKILRTANVGDTIVFDGKCRSDTLWDDCKIVEIIPLESIITSNMEENHINGEEDISDSQENEKIPTEYRTALIKAEEYSAGMHLSKARIYKQLTSEYGEKYSPEAAQFAIDNIEADWNANALEQAKYYQSEMAMSPARIYEQLVSEYGEMFTAEEAQYAIDHLE